MKISKRIWLITLMLFLFFASGCSKNLLHPSDIEPIQPGEEIVSEGDVSSSPVEKADPLSFSAIEQGMQGDASPEYIYRDLSGEADLIEAPSIQDGSVMTRFHDAFFSPA